MPRCTPCCTGCSRSPSTDEHSPYGQGVSMPGTDGLTATAAIISTRATGVPGGERLRSGLPPAGPCHREVVRLAGPAGVQGGGEPGGGGGGEHAHALLGRHERVIVQLLGL